MVQAYDDLADVYKARNETIAAEAVMRKLVDLQPESAWAKGNLGEYYGARGDFADGIAWDEAALKQAKYGMAKVYLADAHVHLGEARLWDAGDVEGAKADFEKAIALRPSDAAAHYGLAAALRALGVEKKDRALLDQSKAELLSALAIAPKDARVKRALVTHDDAVTSIE